MARAADGRRRDRQRGLRSPRPPMKRPCKGAIGSRASPYVKRGLRPSASKTQSVGGSGPARSTGGGRWKPASGQRGAGRAMVWYPYRYRWPARWPRAPPPEGQACERCPHLSGNGVRKMRSRSSVVGLLCLAAAVVWGTAVPSTAGGDSRQPTVRFDVVSVVDGAVVGG